MLNYKALDFLFEEIISSFSKEDLTTWLAFDADREMLELLQAGEIVITYNSIPVTKLVDVRESFIPSPLTEDYTLAA